MDGSFFDETCSQRTSAFAVDIADADSSSTGSDRRWFMQRLEIAGAALVGGAGTTQAQQGITDVDILQFALNLEYLEAEFYTVATSGKTIDQVGIGINGAKVNLNNSLVFTNGGGGRTRFRQAYVTLLCGALLNAGVMPVAKPAINLNALGAEFAPRMIFGWLRERSKTSV